MKNLDTLLLTIVFLVWGTLTFMYATIPAIMMPNSARVWGVGTLIFLALAILAAVTASRRGKGAREK